LPRPTGRCAPPPPIAASLIPKDKKSTISINKILPFWPELGPPGAYIFPLG
jgi:hypothetical protein